MRVVQEEEPWIFAFKCAGCGAQLEAEPKDVKADLFGVRDEYDYKYYVTCPRCGTKHFIPEADISTQVTRSADKKYRRKKDK